MTWFKIDDSFSTHPKVLAIPRRDRTATIGLWTLAGSWCAAQLTDGHLGEHMLDELASAKKHAELLVKVGLWDRTEDGYCFHDWTDWQPTRARVEERREAEARRKQEWRDRKRTGGDGDAPVPPGHPPDETRDTRGTDAHVRSTRPDPTRPVLLPTEEGHSSLRSEHAPKRACRLPADFMPSDQLRRWAADRGFNDTQIAEMTERFRDYWAGVSGAKGAKLDWNGAWRNWVSKENPARVRGAAPAADRELTAAEVEQQLGPDVWSPPTAPVGMTPDEQWEWTREQQVAHIKQRQAAARARLGRTA